MEQQKISSTEKTFPVGTRVRVQLGPSFQPRVSWGVVTAHFNSEGLPVTDEDTRGIYRIVLDTPLTSRVNGHVVRTAHASNSIIQRWARS